MFAACTKSTILYSVRADATLGQLPNDRLSGGQRKDDEVFLLVWDILGGPETSNLKRSNEFGYENQ